MNFDILDLELNEVTNIERVSRSFVAFVLFLHLPF
jgi:hypothetical protein